MNVLILDDDELSANSLKLIIDQIGSHYVHILCDPNDFHFQLSIKHFDLCIVDILLPGFLNGIEILEKASINYDQTTLWLVSGVVKKENIPQKTHLPFSAFFRKPFDEKEVRQEFQKIEKQNAPIESIFNTFYLSSFSESDLSSLVEKHSEILDHQLAVLYCLCSLSQFTGDLILKNQKEEKIVLSFKSGNLMRIQSAHRKSYLGVLLASHGFASAQDIKKILETKSQFSELTGQKLIRNGIISPHALLFILKEQAKIRMSEIIQNDNSYKVELKRVNYDSHLESFSLKEIRMMLGEIIWSKVQVRWIENFYEWNSHSILCPTKGQSFEKNDSIECIKDSYKVFLLIDGTLSMKQLIDLTAKQTQITQEKVLFCLYYLLMSKYVYLQKSSEQKVDFESLKKKLIKFIENSKSLNYYELLNLHLNATEKEIQGRINSAVKFFHPDKYQKSGDTELLLKAQDGIAYLNEIRSVLLNSETRKQYLEEIQKGSKEEAFKMAQELSRAQEFLESRKYLESLTILEKIIDQKGVSSQAVLYYSWAYLKVHKNPRFDKVNTLLHRLSRLSIENKYSYLYHYCKGLIEWSQENPLLARQNFKKSINMNPDFKHVCIDILELENSLKKKNVVMNLFKKNK